MKYRAFLIPFIYELPIFEHMQTLNCFPFAPDSKKKIIPFLNCHPSGQGVVMNTSQSHRITMFFISPSTEKKRKKLPKVRNPETCKQNLWSR